MALNKKENFDDWEDISSQKSPDSQNSYEGWEDITSGIEDRIRRTIGGTVQDIAVTGFKGVVGVGEAAVGLADIPTFGRVGKGLEKYLGYDPEKTQTILSELYSEPQKRAFKAVEQAKGFVDTAKTMIKHPSTIGHAIIESAPQMLGGAATARKLMASGLLKMTPAWNAIIAASIGEGLISAGSTAEGIRQQTKDGFLTAKQAAISTISGMGTTLFAVVGGRVAKKLGIIDPDTLLAGGSNVTSTGVIKRIIGGGISEGAFEELPQSMQEQVWLNAATDKPLLEGVGEAGATGLLSGMAMGSGFNIFTGEQKDTEITQKRDLYIDVIDEGLSTGEIEGEVFTPDDAIVIMKQAYDDKVFTDEDINTLDGQYPQLQAGIRDIIAGRTIKKINTVTNPRFIDRRKDTSKRKQISEMSKEEMVQEIYTDHLTGLKNRRFYEDNVKAPIQVSLDVDSLKAVNDTFGHNAGDMMLKTVGDALRSDNSIHISGDEFIIQGQTEVEVQKTIDKAIKYLEKNPIKVTGKNKKKQSMVVTFSYGIGENLKLADVKMQENKVAREKQGLRAERGETPVGLKTEKLLTKTGKVVAKTKKAIEAEKLKGDLLTETHSISSFSPSNETRDLLSESDKIESQLIKIKDKGEYAITWDKDFAVVSDLNVLKSKRGIGYLNTILEDAEIKARKNGNTYLVLEPKTEALQNTYSKRGYVIDKDFMEGLGRVIMVKKIEPITKSEVDGVIKPIKKKIKDFEPTFDTAITKLKKNELLTLKERNLLIEEVGEEAVIAVETGIKTKKAEKKLTSKEKLIPSGLKPTDNLFNTPNLASNETYAWRAMGEKEYSSLLAGEKEYLGDKQATKSHFLAGVPESAAQFGGKGKYLVEFGNVNITGAEGLVPGSKAGIDNISKVWAYDIKSSSWKEVKDWKAEHLKKIAPITKKVESEITFISGKDLVSRVKDIGSDQGGLSNFTLNRIKSETYKIEEVKISDLLLSDPSLKEFIEESEIRDFVDKPFQSEPIVTSNGEVVDGYNRIAQRLANGEETISVFKGEKEKKENFNVVEPKKTEPKKVEPKKEVKPEKVTTLITKTERETHVTFQEKINEKAKETRKKIDEYKDWKFTEGDKVKSNKSGHIWEITSKLWDHKNNKPQYMAKDLSKPGTSMSFNIEMQDTFKKMEGPKKVEKKEESDVEKAKKIKFIKSRKALLEQTEALKEIEESGPLYFVTDKKSLFIPQLTNIQSVFKGQEVSQLKDGSFAIKTQSGHDLIIKSVDQITPDIVALQIGHGMNALKDGKLIAGQYQDGEIKLVKGVGDKWTLHHESIHFMEDIGVLTKNEVMILKSHIKRLVKVGKFKPSNLEDIGGTEDRANFIADALTKKPQGLLGHIVIKLQDFVDKMVNAFGIKTVKGITRDIKTGQIFKEKSKPLKDNSKEFLKRICRDFKLNLNIKDGSGVLFSNGQSIDLTEHERFMSELAKKYPDLTDKTIVDYEDINGIRLTDGGVQLFIGQTLSKAQFKSLNNYLNTSKYLAESLEYDILTKKEDVLKSGTVHSIKELNRIISSVNLDHGFEPKTLSERNPALYALKEKIRPFFSKLQMSINRKMGGKMPIDQMTKMLKKDGVTDDEVENILGGLTGTVTRQAVMDEIKANTTEFKDVVLGKGYQSEFDNRLTSLIEDLGFESILKTAKKSEAINELQQDLDKTVNSGVVSGLKELKKYFELMDESDFLVFQEKINTKSVKFSAYQEPDAVEGSYREFFVTASSKELISILPTFDQYRDYLPAHSSEAIEGIREQYEFDLAHKDFDRSLLQSLGIDPKSQSFGWYDGHTNYADIQNPVVRIRFNERDIDGQRILFIEEMQGPSESEQKKMPEHLQKRIYDIGVKRVLAYAKENGFNGVSWTTGQMQIDRYDLSKKVSEIHYSEDGGHLLINDVNGENIYNEIDIKPENLHSIIGKDAADRIINNPTIKGDVKKYAGHAKLAFNTLSGIELKIGGEGLKHLYDRQIPSLFKKYGKEEVKKKDIRLTKSFDLRDTYDLVNEGSPDNPKYIFVEKITGREPNMGPYDTMDKAEQAWSKYPVTSEEVNNVPSILITDKTPSSYPQYSVKKSLGERLYKKETKMSDLNTQITGAYDVKDTLMGVKGAGFVLSNGKYVEVEDHVNFMRQIAKNFLNLDPEVINRQSFFLNLQKDMRAIRLDRGEKLSVAIISGVNPSEAQYKLLGSYYDKKSEIYYDITNPVTQEITDSGVVHSIRDLRLAFNKANRISQYSVTESLGERLYENPPSRKETKKLLNTFDRDHMVIAKRVIDESIFQIQDKMHYMNKAQIKAERDNRATLPEEQNTYYSETRYHGRVGALTEDFQETHVDPLIKIMSKKSIDLSDIDQYLHARHAREANAQIKKINPHRKNNEALSGMMNERADVILNKINGSIHASDYKKLAEIVDDITNMQRKLMVESGLETEATVQNWENTYKYYVPLMREGKAGQMPVKGQGYNIRGGQKMRTGSERNVISILSHTVANYEATIIRAEKTAVGRTFLEFVKNNIGPWSIDVQEYTATFNSDGLVVHRPDQKFKMADNVLSVRVDGKDHHITVDKDDHDAMRIISAMKNLDSTSNSATMRVFAKANRWLAMVNTGLNPEFIISNFARDIQTAGYNISDSEAVKIRGKSIRQVGKAWQGIRQFQKGKKDTEWAQWYERFRLAGAKVGWMSSYKDISTREKNLQKSINRMKSGKVNDIRKGLRHSLEFIDQHNIAVENAVRLAVFRNLVEAGIMSELKAGFIAKELTVNFDRKGNAGVAINSLYLFYNASIQGSARIIKAGVKSPKVRKMMLSTVAFATVLDLVNRAIGGDDDDGENRYDKIAPWVKERNLIIMLPENNGYIKIPLPWGYNVFHVMGQSIGEVIGKEDNNTFDSVKRIVGATVNSFNPIESGSSLVQLLSPTLIDPIVQWAENKDWTGRNLKPESSIFAEKPESQKYWNSVRTPSKYIANTLNVLTGGDNIRPGSIDISPELIDLIFDTAVGGAGRFVSDAILTPIKVIREKEIEAYEIPMFRKIYGRSGANVLATDYYRNMDSIDLLRRQLDHYKGNKAKILSIRREYPDELKMITPMKQTKTSISNLNALQKRVDRIRDDKVRKEKTQGIRDRKIKIMKRFNKYYYDIIKEDK